MNRRSRISLAILYALMVFPSLGFALLAIMGGGGPKQGVIEFLFRDTIVLMWVAMPPILILGAATNLGLVDHENRPLPTLIILHPLLPIAYLMILMICSFTFLVLS